jgi:Protein of unknown function (DUF2924)
MTMRDKLAALPMMSVKDLCTQYGKVFNEPTNANNKDWLVKRIAWRMQALNEGGLSERAKLRARELANEADLRLTTPPECQEPTIYPFQRDDRIPLPGSIISRTYKGRTYHVEVLADGFSWNETTYPTVSAVANDITGQHVNGYRFFQIGKEKAE